MAEAVDDDVESVDVRRDAGGVRALDEGDGGGVVFGPGDEGEEGVEVLDAGEGVRGEHLVEESDGGVEGFEASDGVKEVGSGGGCCGGGGGRSGSDGGGGGSERRDGSRPCSHCEE